MVMVRDWSTRWTRKNSCRHTKLLAALAVMALAGFAQAASIDWKSQGYLWDVENNKKAETISGGGIYLCLVMTADDGTESYEFLTHGNVVTSGRTEDIGKVTGGLSYTLRSDIKDGDVLTVLVYDAITETYRNLYYVDESGQVTDKPVTDRFTVSGLSEGKPYLGTFTFATEGNFTNAIPEPTSGLLLLVGLAGLALRRRA